MNNRRRTERKRILFLSTTSPYPIVDGHSLRTYNLLRKAAEDFDIHLLTFVQSRAEEDGVRTLSSFCRKIAAIRVPAAYSGRRLAAGIARSLTSSLPFVVLKYQSRQMAQTMRRWLADQPFDVLHLDMLPLASYRDLAPSVPCVLVDHNVESRLLQRRVSHEQGLRRFFLTIEWLKLRRYEARALGRMDRIVAVSENDRSEMLALSPHAKVTVVDNGVDTDYFSPSHLPAEPNTLVFVGSLRWFPNIDAVNYFSTEILPLIQREIPDVVLQVVGLVPKKPPELPDAVKLLGFVDDPREIIARGALFVVPLRVGGGTRLKILNALAMAKAVVSTSIGSEGLRLTPGQDIVLGESPGEFAHEVIRLLRAPRERRLLGLRGREKVVAQYDWQGLSRIMNGIYESLISQNARC